MTRHVDPLRARFVIRRVGGASRGHRPSRSSSIEPSLHWFIRGSNWVVFHSWRAHRAAVRQTVHILQGAEIHRPSHLLARADKVGDKIVNVRVGGNAIEVVEGQVHL